MRGSKRYSMPSRPGTWSSTTLSWALRSCSRPGSWFVAFREFRHQRGRLGWLEAVRRSKDPTVFTVLFEDSAALIGLVIALIGIALAEILQMPVLDGVASLGIA